MTTPEPVLRIRNMTWSHATPLTDDQLQLAMEKLHDCGVPLAEHLDNLGRIHEQSRDCSDRFHLA